MSTPGLNIALHHFFGSRTRWPDILANKMVSFSLRWQIEGRLIQQRWATCRHRWQKHPAKKRSSLINECAIVLIFDPFTRCAMVNCDGILHTRSLGDRNNQCIFHRDFLAPFCWDSHYGMDDHKEKKQVTWPWYRWRSVECWLIVLILSPFSLVNPIKSTFLLVKIHSFAGQIMLNPHFCWLIPHFYWFPICCGRRCSPFKNQSHFAARPRKPWSEAQ